MYFLGDPQPGYDYELYFYVYMPDFLKIEGSSSGWDYTTGFNQEYDLELEPNNNEARSDYIRNEPERGPSLAPSGEVRDSGMHRMPQSKSCARSMAGGHPARIRTLARTLSSRP
jgi:hypothetical protein